MRIIQLDLDEDDYLLHLINKRIGNTISQKVGDDIVTNLANKGIIDEREARIIMAGLKDKVIAIPSNLKGVVRANILKAMLISIISMQD